MCGIAGELRRHGLGRDSVVLSQLEQLVHRGPDAVGVWSSGRAAIGQTRLSVIDLITGDPPITTPDGSIAVALNGEIYNFQTLREGLARDGHRFATHGDTEVIAHLAEGLDPAELASRLDGMFAVAVWDARRERLVLIRDRVGKKPLYWTMTSQSFVFGSEIKALLSHPEVTADLDPAAIPAYLHLGYVPSPRTFFGGVFSVPPGSALVVDASSEPELVRYWSPRLPSTDDPSIRDPRASVRRELERAVAKRLVSDVPLGAFLSGGVDSSAVVALMAQTSRDRVRTFTIGFDDDAGFDERQWARLVANRWDTDHTEFVVSPSSPELIDELVWHYDQPFGDSSALPTWHLARLTSGSVTVALSGDGGDELFGGYERFAAALVVGRLGRSAAPLSYVLQHVAPLAGRLGPRTERFARHAADGLPNALREWVAYTSSDDVACLMPGFANWAVDDYQRIWRESQGASTLRRILDLNLKTYLLDDLLPKVDRMSMAHGLEVRSPFLDASLSEVVAGLDDRLKINAFGRKKILRESVADLVPKAVLRRHKRGFGVPISRWFRSDLSDYVSGRLGSADARIRSFVDSRALDCVLSEHASGYRDRGHTIWQLLTLESFLRSRDW